MTSTLLKTFMSAVLFAAAAELSTRALFWDGASFGTRAGPIVRRFERSFSLNGFEGSRGPAVFGPKRPQAVRVLVQGDSISWGQGIADERQVFPAQLLERLRADNPNVEMVVLAEPGREIDWHLEQIVKHGASIQPDVIIYQWYVNDLELKTKVDRPAAPLAWWRRIFLNDRLLRHSYFLFFVDYKVGGMMSPPRSYEDYMLEKFAGDTSDWQHYAREFRNWADVTHGLTPRVMVVLYPTTHSPQGTRLAVLHEKVSRLSMQTGIPVLDLYKPFEDLQGRTEGVWASQYDAHPSAMVHQRLAGILYQEVTTLWPDVWKTSRTAMTTRE